MPATSRPYSDIQRQVEEFASYFTAAEGELSRVIVGQREVIRQSLLCLLAGGHALLEGVPGLGKTLLVRTLAQVLDLPFSRIQFTPDLMPADIIGTSILATDALGNRSLQFQPGPLFGNLILADEVNRATPKTQSALLEAMAEQSVSVARTTHRLAEPFFVLATQNPLEMEGTYPLPEAQLDRFTMKILVPAPAVAEMVEILRRTTGQTPVAAVRRLDTVRLVAMKQLVRAVPVAEVVASYISRLVLATHPRDAAASALVRRYVRYGASPRGAQAIMLCAKVLALVAGRGNVALADVRAVATPVLRHRLILNFDAQVDSITPDAIITEVLRTLPVDRELAELEPMLSRGDG